MDLDETWQVGLRSLHESLSKAVFIIRESAKKMGRTGVVFCDVNDTPLLPLFLDRFPPNFPRTRVQDVASRDTWFHIPQKVSIKGRISRKNRLFRVL